MAAASDTQAGDSFKSPGTGKGSSESASPQEKRNGGADPNNVNQHSSQENSLRPFER